MSLGEDQAGGPGPQGDIPAIQTDPLGLGTFDPPPALTPTGFSEEHSYELVEARTETRKVYQNPDGTRTLRLYPGPVHYRTESGALEEINPNLERKSGRIENVAGPRRYELPEEATGATKISSQEGTVSLRLLGAKPARAEIVGNTATYPGAVEGGSLSVGSFANGLEYAVVLTDATSPTTSFSFEVDSSLQPRLSPEGNLELADQQGRVVAKGGKPVAWDSDIEPGAGKLRGDTVPLSIEVLPQGPSRWRIDAQLPKEWAKDPKRRYPITVDPQVSWYVAADTYIIENMPDTNFYAYQTNQIPGEDGWRYLRVAGTETGPGFNFGRQETWWWLNPGDAGGAQFSQVLSVRVLAWAYWQRTCNPLVLKLPVQDWDPLTLTWRNQPPSSDAIAAVSGCPQAVYHEGWIEAYPFDDRLRQAFQNWLDGTWVSRGIALAGDERSLKILASALDGGPGRAPHIDVTYNSPPYLPEPVSPDEQAVTNTDQPVFRFRTKGDPDPGNQVFYQVRISATPDFKGNVATSPWLGPYAHNQVQELSWQVPKGTLRDGLTYYWGVFASDRSLEAPSKLRPPQSGWLRTIRAEVKRLGARPYYGMVPFSIGPRTQLLVNGENGNAVVSVGLPSYPTATEPFAASLVYNSRPKDDFGLDAAYYQNDCKGNRFPRDGVRIRRTDPNISFDWQDKSPDPSIDPECFSARWTGYLYVPEDGFSLALRHDDGARLELDGQVVIDAWAEAGENSYGPVTKGWHSIRLEYYEHRVAAQVQLRWSRPGQQQSATVPPPYFRPRAPVLPQGWEFTKSLVGTFAVERLEVVSESQVLAHTDDGGAYPYTFSQGVWQPPAELEKTNLTRAGDGTWTLEAEDGTQYVFYPNGTLQAALAPSDAVARKPSFVYRYNQRRKLVSIEDITGRTISFYYVDAGGSPSDGFLSRIDYFDGRRTTFEYYPDSGQLKEIVNPGGARVGFEYDQAGHITHIRPTRSFDEGVLYRWRIDYDTDQNALPRVRTVSAPAPFPPSESQRPETRFTYASRDQSGSTTRVADPLGNETEMRFDAVGRLVSTKDPTGIEVSRSYDAASRITKEKLADGSSIKYTYDQRGRLVETAGPKVDPVTGEPQKTKLSIDEGLFGVQAEYYANPQLSPAQPNLPPGPAALRTEPQIGAYWGFGGPPGVGRDNFSARYKAEFEAPVRGLYRFYALSDDGVRVYLGQTQTLLGSVMLIDDWSEHPARESAASVVVPLERGQRVPLTVEYFEAGGTALLQVSVEALAEDGRVVLSKQPIRPEWLRPGYGLVTSVTSPDGTRSLLGYEGEGLDPVRGLVARRELRVPTHDGNVQILKEEMTYDELGRLVRHVRNGGEQTTSVEYYGAQQQIAIPRECGGTGTPINQAGLPKKIVPSTAVDPPKEVVYDAAGRVVAARLTGTQEGWSCRGYDLRDRLVRRKYPTPTTSSVADAGEVSYVYNGDDSLVVADDNKGGRVEQSFDRLGRLRSHRDAAGGLTSYTYDLAGRITQTTGPQGVSNVSYDASARPIQASWDTQGQGVLQAQASYDWAGRVSSLTRSNGWTTTYKYSPTSEVSEIRHERQAQEPLRFIYTRDELGRIVAASSRSGLTNYFYDDASRLVAKREGSEEQSFLFDTRTNKTEDATFQGAARPSANATPARSYITGAEGIWVFTPEGRMRAGRASGNHDASLVWGPESYSDVEVSVKLRFQEGERDAGINLRWRNGGRHRYIVAIRAGDTALHKVKDGQLTTVASVARTHQFGVDYEIKARAKGNVLEVLEKNALGQYERVLSWTDTSLPNQEVLERSGFSQGAVGLFSWNTTTDFDDFSVRTDDGSFLLVKDDFEAYSKDLDGALARWQERRGELYHYSVGSYQPTGLILDPASARMQDGEVRFKIRFDAGTSTEGLDAGVRLRRGRDGAAYHVVLRRRPNQSGELLVLAPNGATLGNVVLPSDPQIGRVYSLRIRITTTQRGNQQGARIQVWLGGGDVANPPANGLLDVTEAPSILTGPGDTAIYTWGSAVGFSDVVVLPASPVDKTPYTYSTADRLTSVGSCSMSGGCISYDYRGNTTKLDGSEYRYDTANRMVWSRSQPEPQNPRIHPLAISPDRRRVVFSSMRDGPSEIYTSSPDGSGLERLTYSPEGVSNTNPRFSPDGQRIVFVSNRDGDQEIYSMASDGTDVRRLTQSPGQDDYPAYSPDGSEIVFVSWRDGQPDLYKMPSAGGAATRLTQDQQTEAYPTYSPDGRWIVFGWAYTSSAPPFAMESQIVVVSSDGTQRHQLTSTPGFNWLPQFSPDQSSIAFAASRQGSRQDIYTIAPDGSQERRITTNPEDDSAPTWLDNHTILFASDRDRPGSGTAELYSIRDDGTQEAKLSQDLRLSSPPSLSSSTSFRTDEPVELEWTYDALSRPYKLTQRRIDGSTYSLWMGYAGPSDTLSYIKDSSSLIHKTSPAPLISSFTQKDQDLTTWRLLWELYDQRGDTKALVDQGGSIVRQQSYTPWGEQQGKPSLPYGFLGSYRRVHIPQTGLDLLGARQYNPKIGRFLSKDPIPGGSSNPYEYSGGDPINRVDPSGTFAPSSLGIIDSIIFDTIILIELICALLGPTACQSIVPQPEPQPSAPVRKPPSRNASSAEPRPIDPSGYRSADTPGGSRGGRFLNGNFSWKDFGADVGWSIVPGGSCARGVRDIARKLGEKSGGGGSGPKWWEWLGAAGNCAAVFVPDANSASPYVTGAANAAGQLSTYVWG